MENILDLREENSKTLLKYTTEVSNALQVLSRGDSVNIVMKT